MKSVVPPASSNRVMAWVMASTWSSKAAAGKVTHSSIQPATQGSRVGEGRNTLPASTNGDMALTRAAFESFGLTGTIPDT